MPSGVDRFELIAGFKLLGGTQNQTITFTLIEPTSGQSTILYTTNPGLVGVGEFYTLEQIGLLTAPFISTSGTTREMVLEVKSVKTSPRGAVTGANTYWDGVMVCALYGYGICP